MSSNSVYMIGDVDIHDLEEYKKYLSNIEKFISKSANQISVF